MAGRPSDLPSHVFVPVFSHVYEDLGEVLGLAGESARPARVSLAVYAILHYQGVAVLAGNDKVKALVDAVVIAPSLPDGAINNSATGYYEAFCGVWWRWLSARVSAWRKEFAELAKGRGLAWSDYDDGSGGEGRGFCGLSALRVEAGFNEAEVGSLYWMKGFPIGSFVSGALKDAGVGYSDFLGILGRHLSEHYQRVELSRIGMEIAKMLPSGASLEAGPAGLLGRARAALDRAFKILAQDFRDYLALTALVRNGSVEEVGLKGSEKHEQIMSRKRFHELAARWELRRLESQLEYYAMLEDYYASQARSADSIAGAAFSVGDLIAGSAYKRMSQSYAEQAVEAAAARAAVARAYREALRGLEAVQVVETPLIPSFDPGSSALSVSLIVFPLVTGVRLRGARREGVSGDVVSTPDGVGVVWAAASVYSAFSRYEFNELVGYNELREEGLVACAYGDGFTLREYYEDGTNRCRVCGVPLCGRHRVLAPRKLLFIRRVRTYCPEHVPPRLKSRRNELSIDEF